MRIAYHMQVATQDQGGHISKLELNATQYLGGFSLANSQFPTEAKTSDPLLP
jgi:hypothetical protein